MASDDSSIDDSELSPDKNGSLTPEAEGKEARKERKRLKREEKEKRREERRKKKLLKSQEGLVCNIVEGKNTHYICKDFILTYTQPCCRTPRNRRG